MKETKNLYKSVILADSLGQYELEMFLYYNYKNPYTQKFLNKQISYDDFLFATKSCKSKFGVIQLLWEEQNKEEEARIKSLASFLGLDILVHSGYVSYNRPKELDIDFLYNKIVSLKSFKIELADQLIANRSGFLFDNQIAPYKLGIFKEGNIAQFNEIPLDIDFNFNKYEKQISKILFSFNLSYKVYKTSNENIRYYIKVNPITENIKEVICSFYDEINKILNSLLDISLDSSFKRLSHPVWLEEFRVLDKKGKCSQLIREENNSQNLDIHQILQSLISYNKENNISIINNSTPPSYFSNPKLPEKIYKKVIKKVNVHEKKKINFNQFKNIVVGRLLAVINANKTGLKANILTVIGNTKFLFEVFQQEERTIQETKRIVNQIIYNLIKGNEKEIYSELKSHINKDKLNWLESLWNLISPLEFNVEFAFGKKKQLPYSELLKFLIIIANHERLKEQKLINFLDKENKIIRFSETKINKVFGFGRSSLQDLFRLLEKGGFCKSRPTPVHEGVTYEFSESFDLDLLCDCFNDVIIKNDYEKTFEKKKLEGKINKFQEEMIKYLYKLGKRYRFWEYMRSLMFKCATKVCKGNESKFVGFFREYNHFFVEPREIK